MSKEPALASRPRERQLLPIGWPGYSPWLAACSFCSVSPSAFSSLP
jgi:hypothetical protein